MCLFTLKQNHNLPLTVARELLFPKPNHSSETQLPPATLMRVINEAFDSLPPKKKNMLPVNKRQPVIMSPPQRNEENCLVIIELHLQETGSVCVQRTSM